MGDSLDPADFLAAALRESRTALADDGFSARVAQRVEVLHRRKKLARRVRVLCAISTVFLVGVAAGIAVVFAVRFLMKFAPSFDLGAVRAHASFSMLAHSGLPPWTLALALAALVIGVAVHAADRDTPLRF
jgi:hypothetical protein